MSDAQLTGDEQNTTFDYRLTLMRFMPAVTFGLQAAALAGMAVSVGAVAMGLAGIFDDSSVAVTHNTCSRNDDAAML